MSLDRKRYLELLAEDVREALAMTDPTQDLPQSGPIHPPSADVQNSPAGAEPLLQFFEWQHLPEGLADVSRPFGLLAEHVVKTLPRNPERTTSLRKLLEAKDCAVRAVLYRT